LTSHLLNEYDDDDDDEFVITTNPFFLGYLSCIMRSLILYCGYRNRNQNKHGECEECGAVVSKTHRRMEQKMSKSRRMWKAVGELEGTLLFAMRMFWKYFYYQRCTLLPCHRSLYNKLCSSFLSFK